MSQPQSTSDQASSQTQSAKSHELGNTDNLANLYRMSRTAGLGSTDYAAINIAAVMTAVIGAASFMALVDPFFLIIPVVGVIIGIIAIRQLNDSSGTQKGFIIAIIGLIACAAFSSVSGYKMYHAWQQEKSDVAALNIMIEDFGKKLAAEDYPSAYTMLDARFRDRVSEQQFTTFFNQMMKPQVGKVTSIASNARFDIEGAPDEPAMRYARGVAIVKVEKAPGDQPLRVEVTYRHAADNWKIFNLGTWFPADQAAPATIQPAGPGL